MPLFAHLGDNMRPHAHKYATLFARMSGVCDSQIILRACAGRVRIIGVRTANETEWPRRFYGFAVFPVSDVTPRDVDLSLSAKYVAYCNATTAH